MTCLAENFKCHNKMLSSYSTRFYQQHGNNPGDFEKEENVYGRSSG